MAVEDLSGCYRALLPGLGGLIPTFDRGDQQFDHSASDLKDFFLVIEPPAADVGGLVQAEKDVTYELISPSRTSTNSGNTGRGGLPSISWGPWQAGL